MVNDSVRRAGTGVSVSDLRRRQSPLCPCRIGEYDVRARQGFSRAGLARSFPQRPRCGAGGAAVRNHRLHRPIDKIGIERRLYTSGERKAMLDPFLPEKPEDVERLKAIQREIHQGFIALVKSRRGGLLSGPEETLFSGEYWTGQRSLELGVADRVGDLRSTLRERFGDKVATTLVSAERSLLGWRIAGVGANYLGELWGGA